MPVINCNAKQLFLVCIGSAECPICGRCIIWPNYLRSVINFGYRHALENATSRTYGNGIRHCLFVLLQYYVTDSKLLGECCIKTRNLLTG